MHEMTLAISLVKLVCEEACKHGVSDVGRLARVDVELGVFNCVEAHALEAAFELAAENTPAHGATLRLDRIPANAQCRDCGHHFELENPRKACPLCGSRNLSCTGGRQCRLVGLTAKDRPIQQTTMGEHS